MGHDVKKRTAHNIYYGVDQDTGELKHISEVPNGLKCACNCIACNTPLKARKGAKRMHHFAHVSNYDCMYADEIAVYKAVAVILSQLHILYLPPITVAFPNWRKNLKGTQKISIDDNSISFQCEPKQYPPKLTVTAHGSNLRILLDFDYYYSEADLSIFRREAQESNHSAVLLYFPNIGVEDFFKPEHLKKIFTEGTIKSKWIRSSLEDKQRKRYLFMSSKPKKLSMGYECEIHKRKNPDQEKYWAAQIDCAYCEFNLVESPDCSCLALAIHQDSVPRDLLNRIIKCRQKNEERIEIQAQQTQDTQLHSGREPLLQYSCQPQRNLLNFLPKKAPLSPTEDELRTEEARIKFSFDPFSTELLRDKFNRRWIKCRHCGEIKQTQDMSSYGGRGIECNLGICSKCSKLNRSAK